MSDNVQDDVLGCASLYDTPDAALYEQCTSLMKEQGFDFVDAWSFSNVPNPPITYSHNPEWIVDQAKKAMTEGQNSGKPFFLYVALTITHEPNVLDAMRDHNYTESPKGTLTGDDIPSTSGMRNRSEILKNITDMRIRQNSEEEAAAGLIWSDEAIGALLTYLKESGQYDDTFVVIQSDHGPAKGLLYEQGSRIPQFVRFPPLFNKKGTRDSAFIMPQDFITSHVDIAAVVFELAGVKLPDEYVLDGKDWSQDVANAIYGFGFGGCCTERYMDIEDSHSIVTENYQYIYRANLDNGTSNYDALVDYADSYDMEQIYDLNVDPNEQNNVIVTDDPTLQAEFCEFQDKMYHYMANVACVDPHDCTFPNRTYCAPTPGPTASPTIAMCCTANVPMSMAMSKCEAVQNDYPAGQVREDKCLNAKSTGIDDATGNYVCKYVPCEEVGFCYDTRGWEEEEEIAVEQEEVLEADGRRNKGGGRTRGGNRETRGRTPKPTNSPSPTAAPVLGNVPLEGCGAMMEPKHCRGRCAWHHGYPEDEDGSYFAAEFARDELVVDGEESERSWYMITAYMSLFVLFVYFVYREFETKAKSVVSNEETSPLLVDIEG